MGYGLSEFPLTLSDLQTFSYAIPRTVVQQLKSLLQTDDSFTDIDMPT